MSADLKKDNEILDKKIKKVITFKSFKLLLLKIILIVCLFFLISTYLFGFYRMKGVSMTPSLNDGDLLLYYKYGKEYKSGDVVYVEKDKEKIVLRVIGKPGDVIDISEDGYLYVNNHVDNNYVFFETLKAEDSDIEFPYKVKEDELFLAGDNRLEATDSRDFGGVKIKDVKGIVISVLRTRRV